MRASIFKIKTEEHCIWWEWDDLNSSVNLLSLEALKEMEELVSSFKSEHSRKALILMSGKSSGFMAGVDIKALQKMKTTSEVALLLKRFQKVFESLRALPMEKIAVLHGPVMGGGLELALCFDYRLSSEKTTLALPETRLGLIPGLGACVYLPRLIGLRKALQMILKGQSVSAKKALSFGLVDEVLPQVILKKRASEVALTAANGRVLKRFNRYNRFFQTFKIYLLSPFVFYLAKKRLLKSTKGLYPAPLAALKVIKKAFWSRSLEKSLSVERACFLELACSRESRELIRLFLLSRKVKKKTEFLSLKLIKKVAVWGAGTMGRDLAFMFSDKGFSSRLIDTNPEALSRSLAKAESLWARQLEKGEADIYEIKAKKRFLSFSLDTKGLSQQDILIEALPEDFQLKQQAIQTLASSESLREEMIFASNTSSLSLNKLSLSYPWPNRFLGMHFFNPAYKMPLVEIVKTKKLESVALEKARALVQSIGKIPLIVKDSPGFLINRILAPYLCEALWLLKEGNSPLYVDKCFSNDFGFHFGPFRLMDEIGLDIVFQALFHLKKAGLSLNVPCEAEKLPLQLGFGRKQGRGFYIHNRANVLKQSEALPLNGKLKELFPGLSKNPAPLKECVERGLFLLINESFKVLAENVVESGEDVDLGLVAGAGFPAVFGGPIAYAKCKGLSFIRQRLEFWQSRHGDRFRVAEKLKT